MCRASLLALFALLAAANPAWAKTELFRTRLGAAVHWEDREITVGLDRTTPSRTVPPEGVRQAIEGAIAVWNSVGGTVPRLRLVSGPDPKVRVRFCRGKWTGERDELGRSEFIADIRTGLVTSATVEFNECERYFAAPDEVGEERFDLQSAIAHELGHVLGLAHSNNPASLMYPTGGTGAVRTPHAEDRIALGSIYGWVPQTPAANGTKPTISASQRTPTDVLSALSTPAPKDRSAPADRREPSAGVRPKRESSGSRP